MDPSGVINYFQDCSTFQSEELGIGLHYLKEHNRVWLLSSWQLQLLQPICLGEQITVGTWPYDFKGFYGYRNFIMKNEKDSVLAVANSIWVYIDTITGRPIRVPEDRLGYMLEPPYPMEPATRKINIPADFVEQRPIIVTKSNIDSYNHVNNGQYIKLAEEYLPSNFKISSMKVEYCMQAVLGDTILPLVTKEENHYTIVLADLKRKPYAIVEFSGTHE
jgi:acyl-ACP thioesterase